MSRNTIFKFAIIIAMLLIWIYNYPEMPARMPVHWDINWSPNSFASKDVWIFGMPLMAMFMIIMFIYLPKLDPKSENYNIFSKEWEIFQFAILMFFAYAYYLSILWAKDSSFDIRRYILIWIWLLFLILGNYMWKIRRNYFVWIKLPWTIDDEDTWNRTHRFWGKMFMLSWFIFILDWFFKFASPVLLYIIIFSIIILPAVYSYLIFKSKKTK